MIDLKSSGYELFNPYQTTTPSGTGLRTPSQWGNAEQMYGNAATNPWFGQAAGMYGDAYNQGPVTNERGYQAGYGNAVRQTEDDIKSLVEKAGFGGRYSSGMGRNVADITGRNMGQFQQNYLDRDQQAREAYRQRQMQAAGGVLGAASGYGANQMNAGEGMRALGGNIADYGRGLASDAYQMGSGLYGVQQNQANDLGNYWQGNQWYSNPALQFGMNLSQYSPERYYPQYKQSGLGQAFNVGTSLAKSIWG